jgi:hypothetical protein
MIGSACIPTCDELGITFLAVQDCFTRGGEGMNVRLSYLEIYNEKARDLLSDSGSDRGMMIVEDPVRGVIVPDLCEFPVRSIEEV